jgi:trimeric autotransporter adhesin
MKFSGLAFRLFLAFLFVGCAVVFAMPQELGIAYRNGTKVLQPSAPFEGLKGIDSNGNVFAVTPAASSALPVGGATADFHFQDAAGSTLSDSSGNSNNATLAAGGNAPTWVQGGLSFSGIQNVALPSALNNSKTLCSFAYMTPLTLTVNYPVLVSSSLGGSGVNLMYDYNSNVDTANPTFAPYIYAGGTGALASPNFMSGFHSVCFTLGTGGGDLNRAYIDGVEVSYTVQGSSYGAQSSGNLYLGSSGVAPFTTSGFTGTFYRFVTWASELTPSQIAAVSKAGIAEIAARGVATVPVGSPQIAPQLIVGIDSLTIGQGLSSPSTQNWAANLSLVNQPAYTLTNYGITGMTVQAVSGAEMNRGALLCNSGTSNPSVYIVLGGENDAAFGSPGTVASVWAYESSIVQTMKKAGCKVYIGTVLSQSGTAGSYGGTFDAFKDAFAAVQLQQWKAIGADGIIDFAAQPLLGADLASTNPAPTACAGGPCFQSDHIHPTAAGHLLMATAASNRLNYDNGYKLENPNYVSTATYTLAAGDGAIVNTATANAAWTMPDCTGQSGAVYTISNPQSAHTLTIVGGTSQPINGLSTPITIASNSSVRLTDVPNAKTVSGCHWTL